MSKSRKRVQYQIIGSSSNPNNPSNCCPGTGNEVLCLSIPSPINVTLLGTQLTLELPCLRLTSEKPLTQSQQQELLNKLTSLIDNLIKGTTSST